MTGLGPGLSADVERTTGVAHVQAHVQHLRFRATLRSVRRKGGTELVPNEVRVLAAALRLDRSAGQFHGYELLKELEPPEGGGRILNNSTLYRALRRFEGFGLVESGWETTEEAAALGREGRPRRYYRLTADGAREAVLALTSTAAKTHGTWADVVIKELGLA